VGPTGAGTTLNSVTFNASGTLTINSSAGNISTTGSAWLTIGNTGTNAANNFIGTTDNQALVFRTNNLNRFSIQPNGDIFVDGSKPIVIRRYNCNNCDNPNRNTGVSGTEWVAVIAGFYPTSNDGNTRSTRARMYLNTTTNTWWFKGDLQNPSNESWDIDVMFIKRQMADDLRPNTPTGGGQGF
jgi:hypothetical protein